MSTTILIWLVTGTAVVLGGLIGEFISHRRHLKQLNTIGSEVMRLQYLAQSKLANDDPDLPDLLSNLNEAVEQTHNAIGALENQATLNREKSATAREIIAASDDIVAMMRDIGANPPLMDASEARSLSDNQVKRNEATLTAR